MKKWIERQKAITKRQRSIIGQQRTVIRPQQAVILRRGYLMGLCEDICYFIHQLLDGESIDASRKIEKARIEKQARIQEEARIQRQKIEKETRAKEWINVKDEIYSRYQLPIAEDAKIIAKDLFGKNIDTVSTFFITDERVVKQRYIEGGDKAVDEYAKNLDIHAFIGGPITATLLRRLKLLENAKRDGKVIDTEIDIDGFPPHGGILYAVDKIDLDGQIIPARRKFSIRCEMTATITEGFRVGPFVLYDGLYLSTKEEMEQITDEDIKPNKNSEKRQRTYASSGKKYGRSDNILVCQHGTDTTLYCNQCKGDIVVSPKKKVIGICIDVSGSMQGIKLAKAKKAIMKVLDKIPVNSNIDVVLIIFSTDLREGYYEEIIPFGTIYTESVKYRAIERINGIAADGATPLYDTLNYFLDRIWPGIEGSIIFPYTYLIVVSDGDDNQSILKNIIYNGDIGEKAFFAKIKAYRESGLIADIIPFAYGESKTYNRLIKDLQNISGKMLINEINPDNIIESLIGNVDSILYGEDNLKMMGLSIDRKNKNVPRRR